MQEALVLDPERLLCTFALDAKSKLVSNRQAKIEFGFIENVWRIVIDHELTDQLFIDQQGNKCQRTDPFSLDDRPK